MNRQVRPPGGVGLQTTYNIGEPPYQRPPRSQSSMQRSQPIPILTSGPSKEPRAALPNSLQPGRSKQPPPERDIYFTSGPRTAYPALPASTRPTPRSSAFPSAPRDAPRGGNMQTAFPSASRDGYRGATTQAPFQSASRDAPRGRAMQAPFTSTPTEEMRGRTTQAPSFEGRSFAPRSHSQGPSKHVRTTSSESSSTSYSEASLFDQPPQTSRWSASDTSDEAAQSIVQRAREKEKGGKGLLKGRAKSEERRGTPAMDDRPPVPRIPSNFEVETPHVGQTLWTRLVSAANSTAKAWETFYNNDVDEDETSGGESRLTSAMKSYYLERAQSKADLPPWLFDVNELQSNGQSYDSVVRPELSRKTTRSAPPNSLDARKGFRDIYDAAAIRTPSPHSARPAAARGVASATTRTTNRLRDLREAKRIAHGVDSEREVAAEVPKTADPTVGPRTRVGLPRGPRGGRI